jgi:hypothetical protein
VPQVRQSVPGPKMTGDPDFLLRGTHQRPRLRLSVRKGACGSPTPINSTGNPGEAPRQFFFEIASQSKGGQARCSWEFFSHNSSEVKKVTGSEANVGHVQFLLRFARDRLHAAISSFHQVEEIEQKQFHNQDAAGCCEPVIRLHAGRLYPC